MSIFTKILNGEISGYKIYEDDTFFCILDIFPKGKGHLLIITKEEYKDIFEIPEDILPKLMILGKKFAQVLKTTFDADGVKFLQNNGKAAGQEVFHYHLHVIPFYENSEKSKGKEDFDEVYKSIMKTINEEN